MRLGMIDQPLAERFDSLSYVFGNFAKAVSGRHDIVELGDALRQPSEGPLRALVESCDVLIDPGMRVLKARANLHEPPGAFYQLLGEAPRGMPEIREAWPYLNSRDVIAVNCEADAAIARLFLENPNAALIPFSIRTDLFQLCEEGRRVEIRRSMGLRENDFVLLYPGRITVEKNVHQLIRIAGALRQRHGNATLLIAGEIDSTPFEEFGSPAGDWTSWIGALPERLGLADGAVRFMGRQTANRLRDLYCACDVMVNATLHHDENFGYAQVEAAACGALVVGSDWGGLKDTVRHGQTGFRIPTCVTQLGVKLDWLGMLSVLDDLAANRLIVPTADARIRHGQSYGPEAFADRLEHLLHGAANQCGGEPLRATAFGRDFWQTCYAPDAPMPDYRRSAEAMRLYCRMIQEYASSDNLGGSEVSILAAPVRWQDAAIVIDDPIFPMEAIPPDTLREDVFRLLEKYRHAPARTIEPEDRAHQWLMERGIVIPSVAPPSSPYVGQSLHMMVS